MKGRRGFGEETRDRILESALHLFSAKGYDGTSIREITKQIGIRESAVYNHFSAKEDILAAILQKFQPRHIGEIYIQGLAEYDPLDPNKAIDYVCSHFLAYWSIPLSRTAFRIMWMETARTPSIMRKMKSSILDILTGIQAQLSGITGQPTEPAVAYAYMGPMFMGNILYWYSVESDDPMEIETILRRHLELFFQTHLNGKMTK